MTSANKFKWQLSISSFIVFMVMLLWAATGYGQDSDKAYDIKYFDTSGPVSLEVRTSGGSISVEGVEGSEARVEMYVRKKNRYIDAGDADLSEFDIDISASGNTITAVVKRESNKRWNWNNTYSISFVVYTPHDTRSRLKTSGGSIKATDLNGSQELKTSGGSIRVKDIKGQTVLNTSGGSITINDLEGNVEAKTSGGRITADNIYGNAELRTSGGSIRVEDIVGNLEAKTSGGSIEATIPEPKEYIRLRTSGGSISINVPSDKGYDLDLDGNRVRAELRNFTGESERDEVNGRLNGGGTRIEAKTSGGSVRLNYL